METLPEEVILNILSRLPAKLVTRLKIVCKLGFCVINNPYFVKLHLERSLATQSNLHFVTKTPILHLADFDTFDNPIELDYPFKRIEHVAVNVVGSCHGLLCIESCDNRFPSFLYNPTTQTHKLLPSIPSALPFDKHMSFGFGFGYDGVSGDYKFVRILQLYHTDTCSFESEVMVYSMKANSWRRVQDLPYNLYYECGGSALVGGAIHWVGADVNSVYLSIISFDLMDETFGSIPLPHFDAEDVHICMCVGVLDACLCFLDNDFEYCDVWIMKEYGMPESWMRLFSIKKRKNDLHYESIVSFSITKKELFLINFYRKTVKLVIETMEVTDVKVADFHRCSGTWVCAENLVMLDDECDDPVNEHEHEIKKSKRKNKKK